MYSHLHWPVLLNWRNTIRVYPIDTCQHPVGAVIIHHLALLDAATVISLLLELVVSLSRLSTFALLLTLHLAPVEELGKSDLLVDPFLEFVQVEELVLGMCVAELRWAQTGVGSILDVLAKKILCRGTVKNELSSMVVRLPT